ncbi:hypothetical protein HF520_14730 [Romboutsia sp. CE17]|uniref:hypothetical protein n=1 Tax=Romboutsia sp. CE17 TaxID=2724150 RepID=UPI001442ABD2|nr:hypothetical protein [Romboutsia sp. CE17]QJA10036.1 hypothetical protein HF520_14730 [Romboutsia sp. CE17]
MNIKAKIINVNFDILQKLIEHRIINMNSDKCIFLEIRKDELLLNKVINGKVYESYILPKNNYSREYINKLGYTMKTIYYYGKEGLALDDKEIFKLENVEINPVILNMSNKNISISKDLDQDVSKYINSIGIVI